MPIDPSIPLGIKPIQQFDILGGAMRGAAIASQQAQAKRLEAISQQEQQEMALKQREQQEKDAITSVLRETQGDLSAAIPRIRQINPLMAAKIETTMTDAQEAKVKLAKARLDHDLNAAEFISRQLNGVTDQQTYDYARAAIGGAGLPTEQMNPQYDPAYVDSLKAKGMSVKEQLDLKKQEIDRLFQERKFQAEQQNVAADNTRADTAESRQAARDEQQAKVEAARLGLERQRVGLEGQRVKIAQQDAGKPRGVTPTAEAAIINRLQTQWSKATASQNAIQRQVTIMEQGLAAGRKGNLPQANEAVLQTFLKILDPDSVVREGEFQRLREGASLTTRAEAMLQRLTQGGFLPMSELEKYAELAKAIQRETKGVVEPIRSRVGKTADRYNIPRDLVMDEGGGTAAAPSGVEVWQWEKGPDGKPRRKK